MSKYFSRHLLYKLRNEIPLERLLGDLRWPHKPREGRLCFVCPKCGESLTATNPRTNLGRCFRCQANFNPIDLVMLIKECDFVTAVHYLEGLASPSSQNR